MPTTHRAAVTLVLACTVALSYATPALAAGDDDLIEFKPALKSSAAKAAVVRSAKCGFSALPSDFDVYAAGGYSGRKLNVQLDQSGHEATQFEIAVNSPVRPVVLMLGAYEPSIWNIGWTADTKIAAVWVSGYHRQVVLGLPKNTPVLNSSYEDRSTTSCKYFYFSDNGQLAGANQLSKSVLGRPIKMFYPGTTDGSAIYIGAPIAPGVRMMTSNAKKLEDVIDKNAPLAGPAGLEDALAKGLIRKATAADYDAYLEVRERGAAKPDLPPVAGDDGKRKATRYFEGYVVLKPFRYPAGLYGAHSTNFIVPLGVRRPEGNPGHSAVYDMNAATCQGARCESR